MLKCSVSETPHSVSHGLTGLQKAGVVTLVTLLLLVVFIALFQSPSRSSPVSPSPLAKPSWHSVATYHGYYIDPNTYSAQLKTNTSTFFLNGTLFRLQLSYNSTTIGDPFLEITVISTAGISTAGGFGGSVCVVPADIKNSGLPGYSNCHVSYSSDRIVSTFGLSRADTFYLNVINVYAQWDVLVEDYY